LLFGKMNPLLKTCLINSNRSTSSTECDPYFDENNISRHSSRSNIVVSTPSLGNNITRSLKDRDPYEIYEPVKMLGTGSMVRADHITVWLICTVHIGPVCNVTSPQLLHCWFTVSLDAMAGNCLYGEET
jgi:hypothetical protein